MDYIVDRAAGSSPALVGTKAWNLFRLRKHVEIPSFVVVTTDAFLDYEKKGRPGPEVRQELNEVLLTMLRDGPVAIRSSGTSEDLPGVSFAGMYNTTLDVKNADEGIRAVIKTWQSLDSPPACDYRKKMGVTRGSMAVIIQHQINPQISGVMVTRNPLQPDQVLIECCKGLGDRLVSGKITPSRYQVREKKIILQRGRKLLEDREVLNLVQRGREIERLFKAPQDIEWAMENEEIYFLQARPVTASVAVHEKKGKVWCNVNVRETIPDPISPMMYSIFESIMFPMIIIDAFGVPISREQYYRYPAVERVLGRLYWNVNNTMALGRTIDPIMRLLNADKNLDPQMAAAFKYVDVEKLPPLIPFFRSLRFSLSAMVRMTLFIIKSSVFVRGTVKKVNRVLYETRSMTESYRLSSDLKTGIANVQQLVEAVGLRISRRYFGGLFLSLFYFILLGKILSVRMGSQGEVIARKTNLGITDKTGEMVQAVEMLAHYARKNSKRLTAHAVRKLWEEDREFQRLFIEFIREFGHRGPAEFDVASPNWREDYDVVFRLIATCQKPVVKPERSAVIKEIVDSARPLERFFIKFFLPRIKAFTPLRENGKHYYFMATARVKDQLLKVGEELVTKKYCEDIRDVFFLELKDLNSIAAGRSTPRRIHEVVKQRKRERAEYDMIDPPDIVFEDGRTVDFTPKSGRVICGESVSFGRVKGRARIVKSFKSSSALKPGEILITHHTDPGWTPLFSICGGVIVEAGGLICHAAMVARELGVPAIVMRSATKLIKDGQEIELNADEGKVVLLRGWERAKEGTKDR